MTRLSEKRDVQDALINHLIGIGWDYLPPEEALQAGSQANSQQLGAKNRRWVRYTIIRAIDMPCL